MVCPSRIASLFALLVVVAASTSRAGGEGPGLRHTFFMAGSVLETRSRTVQLCIGSPDGARAGEEFDVVRVTSDRALNPKVGGARFKHEKVGTVRIDRIVDEHYAEATIISGRARKGDIVRLAEPVKSAQEH